MTSCGGCGETSPAGFRFCGHCGAPLPLVAGPVDELIARLARGQQPEPVRDGRPVEQRRLVTALFADISGFTALAQRLDPEALADIVAGVIAELSAIVGRYQGYVDKYAGDALLAFFGAPVSHEDDATRAVAVALEMHARLDALRPNLPAEAQGLALHIGINTGHAIALIIGNEVRTDYSVLGDSINVAQRLESAAPSGETYIGELTERLTRESFDVEPIAPVVAKGQPEPLPAWRVAGRRARREKSVVLIGRAAERAQLKDAIDRLQSGVGGVVLLTGDPGLGKSSLLGAARADARVSRRALARRARGFVPVGFVVPADRRTARGAGRRSGKRRNVRGARLGAGPGAGRR